MPYQLKTENSDISISAELRIFKLKVYLPVAYESQIILKSEKN